MEDVVDAARYVISVRWLALEPESQSMAAAMQANRARSVNELVDAFSTYQSPVQNLLAADVQGNMVFRTIGVVPLRGATDEIQGAAPAPGWLERYDWMGRIGSPSMPHADRAEIEAQGWFATANQRVRSGSDTAYLGHDFVSPERFNRIGNLLSEITSHDVKSMQRIQADSLSLASLKLLPILLRAKSDHPLAAKALEELRAFDGTMSASKSAPIIIAVWADELTRALISPRVGATLFNSLYGKRTFRMGLEVMLTHPQASRFWCGTGGCDQPSSQALSRALQRIAREQGQDVGQWRCEPPRVSWRPVGLSQAATAVA